MGSAYDQYVYDECDIAELKERVSRDQSTSAYTDGAAYSGCIGSKPPGLEISDKIFTSEDEAADWLSIHSPKDALLIAVKLAEYDTDITAAIDQRIDESRGRLDIIDVRLGGFSTHEASSQTTSIQEEVLARAKSAASKMKACRACGSRVAIAYVHSHECPVCSNEDFLMTATDKKRIANHMAKRSHMVGIIESLLQERELLLKTSAPSRFRWVVGGDCPS